MRSTFSPEDREIIKLLEGLKSIQAEYPPKLLARRREDFVNQVVRWETETDPEASLQDQKVIKLLKSLKSDADVYPPKLLASRRAAFLGQIAQGASMEVEQKLPLQNQDIIRLLESLKPIKAEYPQELLAQRRSAFVGHIVKRNQASWWENFLSSIQDRLIGFTKPQRITPMELMRTSFVIGSLLVATLLGSLLYGNREGLGTALGISPAHQEISNPLLPTPTSTLALAETICQPGYLPPLCLARRFDKSHDLTFQGNGLARAAVAKDAMPSKNGIHQASNINDGLYGSGASWVSYSANSWIKIDLGQATVINLVKFGKDRLGYFTDHNPGQFTISVALADNVYANGDSTNDDREYQRVYDSEEEGFTGVVSGSETVQAIFKPTLARYIKITVTNPRAAIDEVEVFYFNSASAPSSVDDTQESHKTKVPSTATASATLAPTDTSTPVPTDTPTAIPTDTATPIPTDTPAPPPTDTPTPIPTDTPVPVPTDTPMPVPTDTPMPVPTDTPMPIPTI